MILMPIDPPREDATHEGLTQWVRRFVDEYNMLLDRIGAKHEGEKTQEKTNEEELIKRAALAGHPVGSYYISRDPTSPEILFGGKWEPFRGGFLYAEDDEHPAGSTGGEATHTLTLEEMPQHEHRFPRPNWYAQDSLYGMQAAYTTYTWDHSDLHAEQACIGPARTYDPVGGNLPHNNMPPYHADYVWVRIA